MAQRSRRDRDLSIKMIFFISFSVMMLITVAGICFVTLSWVAALANRIVAPENPLASGSMGNVGLAAVLTLLALSVALAFYSRQTRIYLGPIDDLIATTNRFSQGDLGERATIVRRDEIGAISESFNRMAETIHGLVTGLEDKVEERTAQLAESRERLQLLLDSTAEGVYGIDIDGRCTFCNASALRLLGYAHQDQLIGQSMHNLVHHSHKDGSPMSVAECRIQLALSSGTGWHAEDEVFWRRDGTPVEVEYRSYPQFRGNDVVGAVISFTDNSERRRAEEHIRYISYHDSLTGLHNRAYFEEAVRRLDTEEHLPLSIVFADVNGLKLTNDVLGHAAGDELLRRSADALRSVFSDEHVVARVGGDEFAAILPQTDAQAAGRTAARLRRHLGAMHAPLVTTVIAVGTDTKTAVTQEIERTIAAAESAMYREKAVNRKANGADSVRLMIESLHAKSPRDRFHSEVVAELCERLGRRLGLAQAEVRRLREAGYLHDIGKVVLTSDLLQAKGKLDPEQLLKVEQHPMTGYRILNLFDETAGLAEIALAHRENWDGTGYPTGLAGEQIPLLARIVRVAAQYEALTNPWCRAPMSAANALEQIREGSGTLFDPEVVRAFIELTAEDAGGRSPVDAVATAD